MANYTGQKIITMDTVGMVFNRPTKVLAVYLVPNAAADAAILNFFPLDAGNVVSDSEQTLVGTITLGTTLTDDDAARNVLTAARFPDGAALRIKETTGARANLGVHLITTAGNNDVIVSADAGEFVLTNEASKIYRIDALTARLAFHLKSQATTLQPPPPIIIPGGVVLPNLALETLSASAKVLVYID